MTESIFKTAAAARSKDQANIKAVLANESTMEKLNITLPADYKKRLKEYCSNNYTTPAAFIRMAIDEFC